MSCHLRSRDRETFVFFFPSLPLSLSVSIGHETGRLNGVSRVFLRGSKEGETQGGDTSLAAL